MLLVKYLFPISILIFSGCSATSEPEIIFDKPKAQVPKEEPQVRRNKGSLYSMQGASLFADKKDLQIGDIIQVIISEDTTSKTNNKRETSSDNSSNLGGGAFTASGTGKVANLANKLNNNLGVGFSTNSTTSDSGTAKSQVSETFDSTISCIIEETYQNGNYYIKGNKEILIEGQKQKIIITGVIRPYDITSDNSINSSQIANLKLLYDKDGTEADVMETPWGTKILRAIWPF